MVAATALLANAFAAQPSEGAGASSAPAGADGFTEALASLMSLVGQAPATLDSTSPASGGDAGASGATQTLASADQTASSAIDVALQQLATLLAANGATDQASGGPVGGPTVDTAAASTQSVATTAPADASVQASADASLQSLLAILANDTQAQGASASAPTGASSQAAQPLSASSTGVTAQEPAIDPQLLRFIARTIAADRGGSDAPAANASAAPQTAASADAGAEATPTASSGAATQQGAADATSAALDTNAVAQTAASDQAIALPAVAPQLQLSGQSLATGVGADRGKALRAASQTQAASASPLGATIKPADPAPVKPLEPRLVGVDLEADAAPQSLAPTEGDAAQSSQTAAGAASDSADTTQQTVAQAGAAGVIQTDTAAAPFSAAAATALATTHGAAITSQIAAQLASKAATHSAFDFSLDPQGLGRVDVSLKIDPQGQLSAVLSFDSSAVAAEAKSRAGDLQQALQQAGFDVSQSGLSFTSSGGQGWGSAPQGPQQSFAFAQGPAPSDAPPDASLIASLTGASSAGGLDITI